MDAQHARGRAAASCAWARRSRCSPPIEVADDDKPALLRAYLKRWKAEVGVFFDGVGPDSRDAELRRIAPDHPVFRVTVTTA